MASSDYTQAQFTSLGGNAVSPTLLIDEYNAAAIDNPLEQIRILKNQNDDVRFIYNGTLDAGEVTALDAVVANHTGLAPNEDVVQYNQVLVPGDGTQDAHLCVQRGGSTAACLVWNETLDRWEYGLEGSTIPIIRPTFVIFAEENADISVGANNYEYSFGNGAVNTTADPPGIPVAFDCTLIALGISSRDVSGGATASISVTNNGTVVATSGIATGGGANTKCQIVTQVTPDTVNFVAGDTVQFLTASTTGTHDDVRVFAWFERTS